jgi:hypothetical protein
MTDIAIRSGEWEMTGSVILQLETPVVVTCDTFVSEGLTQI